MVDELSQAEKAAVFDQERQMEAWRLNNEIAREVWRREFDKQALMFGATNEYALTGLKGAGLLNTAGLAGVFALLGAEGVKVGPEALLTPIAAFGCGLIFNALAIVTAYLSSLSYALVAQHLDLLWKHSFVEWQPEAKIENEKAEARRAIALVLHIACIADDGGAGR